MKTPEENAVLLLLYAPGVTGLNREPIEGRVRLMKEIFLLDREARSDEPALHIGPFVPYKYGPFNVRVQAALDDLVTSELIRFAGPEPGRIYSLTNSGADETRVQWQQLPPTARKDLFATKSRYNGVPLLKLLEYVYSRYPEYAVHSEILEQVSAGA